MQPSTYRSSPAGESVDILGGDSTPSTSPQRKSRQPFYRNPIVIVILIVLVVLISFVAVRRIHRSETTHYQTAVVAKGSLTLSVSTSGNVVAPEYDVISSSHGTITAINVAIGQQVTSGATLATLSYTDARGNGQTETLTAPNGGTVVAIDGVVNGSAPQSALIVIDDLSTTSLTLNVNEADIAGVKKGQAVTFTATAYADLTTPFKGTITTISADGQNSNNVISYPVTASIDWASLQGAVLFPQMTVNAAIITAQRDQVLLAPGSAASFAQTEADAHVVSADQITSALHQAQTLLIQVQHSDPTAASDDLTASYLLEQHGNTLEVVPVVLGLSDGTNIEVLAGLSAGTGVVVG